MKNTDRQFPGQKKGKIFNLTTNKYVQVKIMRLFSAIILPKFKKKANAQ